MGRPTSDELEWSPQPKRSPHSDRVRTWTVRAAMAVGALGILALYLGSPPTLRDPEAVAACLPRDITLAIVAEYRRPGVLSWAMGAKASDYDPITVERKLAEIGAHTSGGKLYDSRGREIRFFRPYGGGAQPHPQLIEAQRKELQRLRGLYTVIEIAPYDPRNPPI